MAPPPVTQIPEITDEWGGARCPDRGAIVWGHVQYEFYELCPWPPIAEIVVWVPPPYDMLSNIPLVRGRY